MHTITNAANMPLVKFPMPEAAKTCFFNTPCWGVIKVIDYSRLNKAIVIMVSPPLTTEEELRQIAYTLRINGIDDLAVTKGINTGLYYMSFPIDRATLQVNRKVLNPFFIQK